MASSATDIVRRLSQPICERCLRFPTAQSLISVWQWISRHCSEGFLFFFLCFLGIVPIAKHRRFGLSHVFFYYQCLYHSLTASYLSLSLWLLRSSGESELGKTELSLWKPSLKLGVCVFFFFPAMWTDYETGKTCINNNWVPIDIDNEGDWKFGMYRPCIFFGRDWSIGSRSALRLAPLV